MIKNPRYEISGFVADAFAPTLTEARRIAKKKAISNFKRRGKATLWILIYKLSIPGNPYSEGILFEKWKVDQDGDLVQITNQEVKKRMRIKRILKKKTGQ